MKIEGNVFAGRQRQSEMPGIKLMRDNNSLVWSVMSARVFVKMGNVFRRRFSLLLAACARRQPLPALPCLY